MPLELDITPVPNSRLGVWKIEEDLDHLKWELQWGQHDIKQFRAINDSERSMHWLVSRVLLRRLLNTSKFIDMQCDEHGKPYLVNFDYHISISHSGDRVAVLLSEKDCGVDIQLMKPRIEAVAHKFISDEEWTYLKDDTFTEQIYVFWCAKEALYKLYGKRKLEFRQHLFLHPFDMSSGLVKGRIEKGSYFKELPVYFQKVDNYLLAFAVEE
jgi:phosphopantetheinyl transferase